MTSVVWLATVATQYAQLTRPSPQLVSETAPPAIDRGMRDLDPPRDPRTDTASRTAASDEPFVRGSLIVKFRPGTSVETQRRLLARVEGSAAATPSYATFDILSIDPRADPEAVSRQLEAQPDVEYAQARYRVYPRFIPNDPQYSRQWNFPAIDMERAWDINPGAAPSVTVAVLDSGVAFRSGVMRYTARDFRFFIGRQPGPIFPALGMIDVPFAAAPDLGGPERFVSPRDFIWDTTNPVDLDGHGTHVSGTVGQLTNNGVGVAGMAFNVRIMPVKVIATLWDDIFGSPQVGTDDIVARGIRYAVDNGAKVLNVSVGRSGPSAPVVREAMAYAVARGAFVAVAGGNDFEDGNSIERFAEFAPDIEGMVAVGAVGRDRRRAFYSNTGAYIELAAPGGNTRVGGTGGAILQQTFDLDLVDTFLSGPAQYRAPRFDAFTYEFLQGTSMATPHVAGFAALLMQQGIASPAAIEAVMKRYATDLGPPGRDDEYGYGLINPRNSLRGLGLAR
ncbi:MAG: S8 family serine peptidase [Vicinamibacterales bacterium]